MAIFKRRIRPEPWLRHRERAKNVWLVPLFAIEWVWTWLAYWLSGWAFLEVLEYLGTLSLLLARKNHKKASKAASYFCKLLVFNKLNFTKRRPLR